MTRPGFEPGPPRWEAGDEQPELWRGLFFLTHLAREYISLCVYEIEM
jgi:hypothetical protein